MSSMLSKTDVDSFVKSYSDFFETFQRDIIIYKQVKQIAVNVATPLVFGYDTPSNVTNYTNIIQSGVFKALVINTSSTKEDKSIGDTNSFFNNSTCTIKVEENAKKFIDEGIEKVVIDNTNYDIIGHDKKVNFLSKSYYMYELKESV